MLEGNHQVSVAKYESELSEQVLPVSAKDVDRSLGKRLLNGALLADIRVSETGDEFACVISPEHEGFLGPEVAVHRRRRDASGLGNLFDRHVRKA